MDRMNSLTIVLLCLPIFGFAQNNEVDKEELVRRMSAFRSEVILADANETKELDKLLKRIGDDNCSENCELLRAFYTVYFEKNILSASDEKCLKKVQKKISKFNPEIKLTIKDVNTILNNMQIINLIGYNIVNGKYPFALKENEELLEQILFYSFEPGDQVGEIISGERLVSILVAAMYDDLKITVCESGALHMDLLRQNIFLFAKFFASKVEIVEWTWKKNNFKNNSMDKIIVQVPFNYKRKKEKVLSSIASSLKSNGQLFLFDYNKLDVDELEGSKQLEVINETIRFVESNGFQLEGKKQTGTKMFMRFSVVR